MSKLRGNMPDSGLKLSHDRKVSPRGIYQASRDRWTATVPNSFGLPAGTSCPGKTEFCEKCYAVGSEQSKGVGELVQHNYRLLTEAGSLQGMIELLTTMIAMYRGEVDRIQLPQKDRLFRIHWDGDFFSETYARAWSRVIRNNPDIQFWAYTRSFVPPVNVVPILAGIENLSLYLSADEQNIVEARAIVAERNDVMLAVCAIDYQTARAMLDESRPSLICPENNGKMPLMNEKGRGACVDCMICPVGRKDVVFSVLHREKADENVRITSTIKFASGICENPGCGNLVARHVGRGRKRRFCSRECQVKAGARGKDKALTELLNLIEVTGKG